jgi:hypothetical protein
MRDQHETARQWKAVLITAFVLAILTSIPQIHLLYVRGSEWNGSCALLDPDELAYLAYTNALISGRPRRNDPYSGKDSSESETLYSVQFLPAYVVAIPARIAGISADSAFILLLVGATVATFLVAWWLLFELTHNHMLALIGAVCILAFSTAAAHSPIQIFKGIESGYDPFPFLRRYIPAFPFPIFLASTIFIWRALTRDLKWALLAGLSFWVLVYSYFFLWTAVAAWFFTILVVWMLARPDDRKRVLQVSGILIGMAFVALAPYAWLLTRRETSMDRGQILELRHTPDLFRAPELYGALILLVLVHQIRRRSIAFNDGRTLFLASFAIAPFVVFNQQILTGRSLQPFHYEEFAANYWVVVAAFLALGILRTKLPQRILIYLAAAGTGFTLMLAVQGTRLMAETNIRLDQVRPAALNLKSKDFDGVVFASDRFLTHSVPAVSNKPVLWSRYLYTFSTINLVDQRRRYYQYLYYSGVERNQFVRLLQHDFTSQWEVFGAERVNPVLTANHEPIAESEIEGAAQEYAAFLSSFDSNLATNPLLAYAVVHPNDNLSNLDRWYERESGERVGEFISYRLRVKTTR